MSATPAGSKLASIAKAAWPSREWQGLNVVVAVSGGADSVALLRTLVDIKEDAGGPGRMLVAHYNHGLRGAASDADAEWVASLCDHLGVPCEIGRPGQAPTDASEEAARDARYDFLLSTAERFGARFVATAHTADDQLETVLMRMLRGTGVAGLSGVPPRRALSGGVTLVRPLLAARRELILEMLDAIGQKYRTDASNADERYTRNRVRHTLLPLLREQAGHDVDASLLALAEQAAETQAVIESVARPLAESAINFQSHDQTLTIRCESFASITSLIVAEAVKLAWRAAGWPEQAMGRQQWRQLDRLIRDEAGEVFDLPGAVHARRVGDRVVLSRR